MLMAPVNNHSVCSYLLFNVFYDVLFDMHLTAHCSELGLRHKVVRIQGILSSLLPQAAGITIFDMSFPLTACFCWPPMFLSAPSYPPTPHIPPSLAPSGPPGPPGGVRVEEVKDKSVKLIWSRGSDNHSPISKYTIQCKDFFSQDDWRDATTCEFTQTAQINRLQHYMLSCQSYVGATMTVSEQEIHYSE